MSRFDTADRFAASLSKTGKLVREPILLINLLGALLLEVCILLRQFGVPLNDGQVDAINAVAGLLLLIAAALFGRKLTTPLADPRDRTGQPLTPDDPDVGEISDQPTAGPDAPALPPTGTDVAADLPTSQPVSAREADNPFGGHQQKP